MTHEYVPDQRVADELVVATQPFTAHHRVTCDSTQLEVRRLLDLGATPPIVVTAEEQTGGRGRLDRTWVAPLGSSVLMSVGMPMPSSPQFTLMAGVVVAEALRALGVSVQLKWPNDVVVMVEGHLRKLGGILTEVHREHVIVGVGINLDIASEKLPTSEAISCAQLGVIPERSQLVSDIAAGLIALPGAATMDRYRELCISVGADVEVQSIAGRSILGRVLRVDEDGTLVLFSQQEEIRVTVGDVRHLRSVVA